MATVNLGSIKFKWRGTYNGATAYTVDDVVSYNGSSYICILASTGNLPTDATYFEQMSSVGTNGTNGTDLTTTLSTQGDLVYRDGSGLQRLGAGTAGQVLQTGGAGANPSWGTVSSDYVKVAGGSISASSELAFNTSNFDGSTYNTFDIILEFRPNTNASDSLYMHYSNNNLSSNYGTGMSSVIYDANSSTSTAPAPIVTENNNIWRINSNGHRTNSTTLLKMTITGLNRNTHKSAVWQCMRNNHDGDTRAYLAQGGGTIDEASGTNNAIKFVFSGSQQFVNGTYRVYGYK
jgi:hypothetical protein